MLFTWSFLDATHRILHTVIRLYLLHPLASLQDHCPLSMKSKLDKASDIYYTFVGDQIVYFFTPYELDSQNDNEYKKNALNYFANFCDGIPFDSTS